MKHSFKKLLRSDSQPQTLFEALLLGAPIAIWFSYYPLMRFGSDTSMYFELSITTLYLLLLSLVSIPIIWQAKTQLLRSKVLWLPTAFVVFSGLSILWTANTTRGALTFGVIGSLYLVLLASVSSAAHVKKMIPALTKTLIASAVLMSLLSLVQIIAGIWLNREATLSCPGCVAGQLGFVRPNAFTIEPQFLGNVLLAPALILSRAIIQKRREMYTALSFFIVVTGQFLTLSRGAIFAFIVGVIIILLVELRDIKRLTLPALLTLGSFLACLLIQGSAAAANPHLDISFRQAIRTSVNQLSLGVIQLPNSSDTPKTTVVTKSSSPDVAIPPSNVKEATPNFNGYVEESTDVRLKLSSLSVQTWEKSVPRIFFGTGLGGSGTVLHQTFPDRVNEREIVQNEFIEILLETGLIGISIFTGMILLVIFGLRRHKWLWAIIGAFLVQWNFFSGYPNALHIYFIFIIFAVIGYYKSNTHRL